MIADKIIRGFSIAFVLFVMLGVISTVANMAMADSPSIQSSQKTKSFGPEQ